MTLIWRPQESTGTYRHCTHYTVRHSKAGASGGTSGQLSGPRGGVHAEIARLALAYDREGCPDTIPALQSDPGATHWIHPRRTHRPLTLIWTILVPSRGYLTVHSKAYRLRGASGGTSGQLSGPRGGVHAEIARLALANDREDALTRFLHSRAIPERLPGSTRGKHTSRRSPKLIQTPCADAILHMEPYDRGIRSTTFFHHQSATARLCFQHF